MVPYTRLVFRYLHILYHYICAVIHCELLLPTNFNPFEITFINTVMGPLSKS